MDLCLDGFDVLGLDSLGPSRGWSMKRGHRKRLDAASCRNPKKMGKASEEVGLGRSAAKRSVNSGSRNAWRDPDYLGKYGCDYHPQTRRNNLRRWMREAVYESEELESEWEEDYAILSLEHVGSLEAKWEDLEVASVCSSTTAGFGTASTASDFGWEFLQPITPSCPSAPKIDISPWQAAMRRAERGAKEYVAEVVNLPEGKKSAEKKEASQRHLSQKAALSNEVKFLDDLGRLHRARVGYDDASLKDTAPSFEKLRWGFLKDFGDSICSGLSSCYNGVWDLRPAPIDKDVQRMFMDAQRTSKKSDALQPALHGTNQSNLGSIYSRGLLIPGNHNGLRVVNGSAYGLGIYTAYVQNASMSMNYSRGPLRPVLVCGVIDEKSGATQPMGRSGDVYYTSHARIFYKEELVAPLFEATFSGNHATAGAVLRPPVRSPSRRSALLRARALELAEDRTKTKKGLKGPRTRLKPRPAASTKVLSSAQAFLARRAVRRRQP